MMKEGLGDLDKSGIAELTFKGRKGHPLLNSNELAESNH